MLARYDEYMTEHPPTSPEKVPIARPAPPPKPERSIRSEPPPGRRRQVSQEPTKSILIPRLKYDNTFHAEAALEFVIECNRFVQQLSDRISELERAVSVLHARIVELEVYYDLE
jgi:hypothetical protein